MLAKDCQVLQTSLTVIAHQMMLLWHSSGDASAQAVGASPVRPAFRKLSKRVQFQGLSLELIDYRSGSGNSQDLQSSCWAEASQSPSPPSAQVWDN